MAKILAYDSMYISNPVGKIYTALVNNLLKRENFKNSTVVLYRLDPDNVFITDNRNISGMTIGVHKDHIDAMSIKFYQYLQKFRCQEVLSIKGVLLYELYTRQVKLKLEGVLRCALRIKRLSIENKENIEIITDRQTVSIIEEAFLFLNYAPTNITWKAHGLLTSCITINSLIMRFVIQVIYPFTSIKIKQLK